MSISSEITRISNAKTAISESIANKGVTVPSGTKIDGMATLIDSIQTGGAAVQPSKALTVTSNGTTTITPDAPYDAIKQVDLTVNVSGGGVEDTVTVTLPIGPQNFNYDMEVTATYTNALGEIVANVPAGKAASYTVKKGSIFFIYGYLKNLTGLSSPSLYGVAGADSTDPRFHSNNKAGVFFVCDSDVTVVY